MWHLQINHKKHGDFPSVGYPPALLPELTKDTPALLTKLDISDRVISLTDWQLRLLMSGNGAVQLDIHNCRRLTKVSSVNSVTKIFRKNIPLISTGRLCWCLLRRPCSTQ